MDAWGAGRADVAAASIPPFFESPVSALLIMVFICGLASLASLHAHRGWMRDSTLIAWVAVIIIGGPLGAVCWFAWGRPAVRRFGVAGEKGLLTDDDYP